MGNWAERRTRRGHGGWLRPSSPPSKGLSLGLLGPYLAVDLLDQGLAVLVLLLELADLPELLGGEILEPLRDLIDGQLIVVGGLEGTEYGGLQLRLLCDLLGLLEDFLGLLCCLLGYPETLPCYLLCCLQPLLGGPLGRPQALPKVCQGGEEVPVGPSPSPGELPEGLLLLAYAPRKSLSGLHIVLGLLAHSLYSLAHPALHKLGVALLELKEPHATSEPLLGRPGVLLLQPHELEPAFGKPDTPALGGREVLGESLVRIALNLSHLAGGARRLVDVSGGLHQYTSVGSRSATLYSYHTYTHIALFKTSACGVDTMSGDREKKGRKGPRWRDRRTRPHYRMPARTASSSARCAQTS